MAQSDNLPIDDQDRADDPAVEQGPPLCLFGPGGDFTRAWPPHAAINAQPDAIARYKRTGETTTRVLRAVAMLTDNVRRAQRRFFRTKDPDDMRRAMVLEQDLDRGLLVIFGPPSMFQGGPEQRTGQ